MRAIAVRPDNDEVRAGIDRIEPDDIGRATNPHVDPRHVRSQIAGDFAQPIHGLVERIFLQCLGRKRLCHEERWPRWRLYRVNERQLRARRQGLRNPRRDRRGRGAEVHADNDCIEPHCKPR